MNKLDLLMIQNWIIVALLVVFIVLLVKGAKVHRQLREAPNLLSDGVDINDLWFTDNLDELLVATERILKKHPNRTDALYLRAKAKAKQGHSAEADALFKQLILIEPGRRPYIEEEMLGAINKASKPKLGSVTKISDLRDTDDESPTS